MKSISQLRKHNLARTRRTAAAACYAYPGSYACITDDGLIELRQGGAHIINPYRDWSERKRRFGAITKSQ